MLRFLVVLLALLMVVEGYVLPTLHSDETEPKPTENGETTVNDVFTLEVPRFAQLLSIHIYFDHLDSAYTMFSDMISATVHDSIQLTVASSTTESNVDVQILKGQLEGAINSYIQDQLPMLWNRRASSLDKQSLQSYIENMTVEFCQPGPVTNVCLEQNAHQFLARLDRYVSDHVQRAFYEVSDNDLTELYETIRMQVQSTLTHFHRYVLQASDDQILLKSSRYPSKLDADQMRDIAQVASRQVTESKTSISRFALLARAFP